MPAPVIERVVVFRYPRMESEIFNGFRHTWKDCLENAGFEEEVINSWSVKLPTSEDNKMPDLTKLSVNHNKAYRFWNKEKSFCTQFYADCLTFNLLSKPHKPGKYEQLKVQTEQLLPQWLGLTKIRFTEIALQYINDFTSNHLKPFINDDGSVQLGHAFTVFTLPPKLGTQIQLPYRLDFILDHKKNAVPCKLNVNVILNQIPKDAASPTNVFDINFLAQHNPAKNADTSQPWAILDSLHEEIITAFRNILTREMLNVCEIEL